jgi:type IV secretory pathway VirB10-like protein
MMSASNPTLNREKTNFQREPELGTHAPEPTGVIRKNLKMQVYLGIAVLFIVATAVSSLRHKPAPRPQAQAVPTLENSNANIEEMKRSLELEQHQAAAVQIPNQPTPVTPAQSSSPPIPPYYQSPNPDGSICAPGQPCPAAAYLRSSEPLSPQQQEQMQLQQQEKELAYKARFASNLAYSQSHVINGSSNIAASNQNSANPRIPERPTIAPESFPSLANPDTAPYTSRLQPSSLLGEKTLQASKESQDQSSYKSPTEANVNSATGQPYVVYEGTLIETALMNRLDGDASGPAKVLVTNPVYSHDHQHVLIPDGTVVLGESNKIGNAGFGQQRRLAVVFHRMIMPDGFSVDLDQFKGLNQIGETGLKDKVNNHYLQIFGSSIALGLISGAAEVSSTGGVVTGNGADAYKYGVASSLSQSSTNVLDKFVNIPPTITIREGHRVKVYISQDLLLPAYENHTIPSTF